MEVKQQDEEEESDTGSCSKGGKLGSLKTEEKPVKSELKKEDCSGEGGKGVPMDTMTTTPTVGLKTEDRKPEVKKEVKEEEDTSETATPQAPVKKKSKECFCFLPENFLQYYYSSPNGSFKQRKMFFDYLFILFSSSISISSQSSSPRSFVRP